MLHALFLLAVLGVESQTLYKKINFEKGVAVLVLDKDTITMV